MKFNEKQLLLYAVTHRKWTGKRTFYQQIEDALKGGVTMLQLREKDKTDHEYIQEAVAVKEICRRYDVPLIINDNLTVALKSGADGIHVGQEDRSAAEIRKIAGPDFIIGVTAKTVEQAKQAEIDGADYLGVGAVFPSPSKENAIRISKDDLKQICSSVSIPAIAIGGISYDNMLELKDCGMKGVALISAVFSAEDIRREAIRLKERSAYITGYEGGTEER